MNRLYDSMEPRVIDDGMLKLAVGEQGPQEETGELAKQEGILFKDVLFLQLDFRKQWMCQSHRGRAAIGGLSDQGQKTHLENPTQGWEVAGSPGQNRPHPGSTGGNCGQYDSGKSGHKQGAGEQAPVPPSPGNPGRRSTAIQL
ncbi:hypothetical protein P7K49_010421 [Saguinus oedipus]|uniref:Uncharacterized protein n=1 Tax=Saguinus oedipus TaxID=9490 RepID=A0ABQ9VMQ3_SAGOE|nr:hypothetical protein P7K49_010421 [Saguinus oedipus]